LLGVAAAVGTGVRVGAGEEVGALVGALVGAVVGTAVAGPGVAVTARYDVYGMLVALGTSKIKGGVAVGNTTCMLVSTIRVPYA
jgi:hypothetical protein